MQSIYNSKLKETLYKEKLQNPQIFTFTNLKRLKSFFLKKVLHISKKLFNFVKS